MIRFSLYCEQDHNFEGWFRNDADFGGQRDKSLIACPICSSTKIDKALMKPAVVSNQSTFLYNQTKSNDRQQLANLRMMIKAIKNSSDYVGKDFSEEVRKIHFGEVTSRAIYGEANYDEILDLLEDGVPILPLPELPEDKN